MIRASLLFFITTKCHSPSSGQEAARVAEIPSNVQFQPRFFAASLVPMEIS